MDARSLALVPLMVGCAGTIGSDGGATHGGASTTPPVVLPAALAPTSGLRRLTAAEYDNAVHDLLGEAARDGAQSLPEDRRTPFDNDYSLQEPSAPLVAGLEFLARARVAALVGDGGRRARVFDCAPAQPAFRGCVQQFVARFGRRALRRPLTEAEALRFQALFADARQPADVDAALTTVLLAFLQHPEFVYRVERGTPVASAPGILRLDAFELATRLSFFLWDTIPDDRLLDDAQAGRLDDAAGVGAAARRLLADPRARETIDRFVAQWLNLESIGVEGRLGRAMKAETRALIERVVFDERRPWQDVFRSKETFVDEALARHYGLPSPGARPGWVSYGGTGRKGLLSHGTFLAGSGSKGGDTSPTQRGLAIRERLFCMTIPPPPPNVNANDPPPVTAEARCKEDRYAGHRDVGCARCHKFIDPVGFGLERFDSQGRYRTVEPGKADCPISGVGELAGVGEFEGPAGLTDLMLKSGEPTTCVTRQLLRLAYGRSQLNEVDDRAVALLVDSLGPRAADFRLDDLIVTLVSSEAFRHRREDARSGT